MLASTSKEKGFAHRKLKRCKLFKRTERRTPHPSVPGRERLPPASATRGQGEAPCALLLPAAPDFGSLAQGLGFAFCLLCIPSLHQATHVPTTSPASLSLSEPLTLSYDPIPSNIVKIPLDPADRLNDPIFSVPRSFSLSPVAAPTLFTSPDSLLHAFP